MHYQRFQSLRDFHLGICSDDKFKVSNKYTAVFEDSKNTKVWVKKNRTDVLLNITKVVVPTVKIQAKGQNNLSRTLK